MVVPNAVVLLLAVAAAVGQDIPPPVPGNMEEVESAVLQFARDFATRDLRVPSRRPRDIDDALRLPPQPSPLSVARKVSRLGAENAKLGGEYFVAMDGDDRASGAKQSPWATVQHALSQVAGKGPCTVYVREGTYYINDTLRITERHSGVHLTGYNGERVVFFGGRRLSLDWKPAVGIEGVYVARVSLPKRGPGLAPEIVNQLFVNGTRMIRARYPNADPATTPGQCFLQGQYEGEGCLAWLEAQGAAGQQRPGSLVAHITSGPNRGTSKQGCAECDHFSEFGYNIYDPPAGHPVYNKPLPGVGWANNSVFYYYSSPFDRVGELLTVPGSFPRKWANPSTGVLHLFHGSLWGTWQFRISQRTPDRLILPYGGYQNRDGSVVHNRYYVENIFEELDTPGEWFYDEESELLYLYPNASNPNFAATTVAVPLVDSIIRVEGSTGPATAITVSGIEFTGTRATFLEQYEMPSAGDWAIHRGGALFVTNAERVVVQGCEFVETGGNGVVFSNHVVFSRIESSEFVRTGDSAVVFVGRTEGINGMGATYPMNNTVAYNHMHEIGVYGKQTSCFFQSLSANSTIYGNLCYNGPRAGINFNDGFGGGHHMEHNLIFNMVRETGDHGPFNSWDRQPYLTRSGVDDGYPPEEKLGYADASIVAAQSYIERNFIINGYGGVWTIDHDDGSQFYNDTANFLVWGGCKNFLGNSKSCSHNVILYPGIPNRSQGARKCQTDDNSVFANQYYHSNDCITSDGSVYSINNFLGTTPCNKTSLTANRAFYQTHLNRFYTPNHTFVVTCKDQFTFDEWQALHQDIGSSLHPVPSVKEIIAMARTRLGL